MDRVVMLSRLRNVKLGAGLTDAAFMHPSIKDTTTGPSDQ